MRSRASYKAHLLHPAPSPFPFAFLYGPFALDVSATADVGSLLLRILGGASRCSIDGHPQRRTDASNARTVRHG